MAKIRRQKIPDLRPHHDVLMALVDDRCDINLVTGCWEWTAGRNALGYAQLCFKGFRGPATRIIYAAIHGPFDERLDICHSCDNPMCVNPDHITVDTHRNNILDAARKKRMQGQWKTHCLRGHPLSGDNLQKNGKLGFRHCRACDTAKSRMERGWPKDLAFNTGKIPAGYMMDRSTWQVVPVAAKRGIANGI